LVLPDELDEPLSATIQQALKNSRNITSLYSHQAVAIGALNSGKNVIISTSTASGKSVIYQVGAVDIYALAICHSSLCFIYL
jgi:DEAD/DEAH box helicase domain-containing protein